MNFVIIFSGQGLQSIKHMQEIKDTAQELGLSEQFQPLIHQISDADFNPAQLFDNQVAQPFIFALQYLRWQKIKAHFPEPMLLSGYSLGEASAVCCSMALDISAATQLILKRAMLMDNLCTQSGLAAIQGLNLKQLLPLLQHSSTEISIKLNDTHYIIGGTEIALEQLIDCAKAHGAQQASKLKVSIPSHTSFMQDAAEGFADYLQSLTLKNMHIPIISASDGQKYCHPQQAITILAAQIDHALNWHKCMEIIREYQPDVILEIGPGNALTRMISATMPNVQARSFDDFSHFEGVKNWLEKFI